MNELAPAPPALPFASMPAPHVGAVGRVTGGVSAALFATGLVALLLAAAQPADPAGAHWYREFQAQVMIVAALLCTGHLVLGLALLSGRLWARTTLLVLTGLQAFVTAGLALVLFGPLVYDAMSTRRRRSS
ncbi:MAG: hypothetical protein SGJ13_01510 [Actinomycetota bacterium]|nr:hypothetical protein [Actinomycetota bacterium]